MFETIDDVVEHVNKFGALMNIFKDAVLNKKPKNVTNIFH